MESSIFRRNISFAAFALAAIVVNVFVVNHKIDVATPVMQFNQTVATAISSFVSSVPNMVGYETKAEDPIEKIVANKTDLQCMAENIYYEAATQSYVGKLAVGQVVMNRLKSSDRPSTICGVIYEGARNSRTTTCQFSWRCSPNIPPIKKDSKAWEISLKVALDLLTQKTSTDFLEGAQYYHADYVKPVWTKQLRYVTTIDNHLFYAQK